MYICLYILFIKTQKHLLSQKDVEHAFGKAKKLPEQSTRHQKTFEAKLFLHRNSRESVGLDPYLREYGGFDNKVWLELSKSIARLESSKCPGRTRSCGYNPYNVFAPPLITTAVTNIRNKIGLNRNNKKKKSQTVDIEMKEQEEDDSDIEIGIEDGRGCCDMYESLPFGFDIGCDECNDFYHEKCLLLKYGYNKKQLAELSKKIEKLENCGVLFY